MKIVHIPPTVFGSDRCPEDLEGVDRNQAVTTFLEHVYPVSHESASPRVSGDVLR